jgi:hypothetical protein
MLLSVMSKDDTTSILHRFLEQKRAPIFTGVSLLTMVLVLPLVIVLLVQKPEAWGELAQLAALVLLMIIGMLIDGIVGSIAHARREYCGGWIAALGVVVWVLTLVIVTTLRMAWFTRR